jgi:hypothetical protein
MHKRYLTRQEAADYLSERGLQIAKNTLQKYATTGGDPEYCIFGNRVFVYAGGSGSLGSSKGEAVRLHQRRSRK